MNRQRLVCAILLAVVIAIINAPGPGVAQDQPAAAEKAIAALEAVRIDDAVEIFYLLIESAPQGRLHFYRGLAYAINGKEEAAIEDYSQAISMEPDQAEYYFQYQVIRNERSLNAIRDYIAQIPVQLANDPDNPDYSQE